MLKLNNIVPISIHAEDTEKGMKKSKKNKTSKNYTQYWSL
jgi:hypothetical protein